MEQLRIFVVALNSTVKRLENAGLKISERNYKKSHVYLLNMHWLETVKGVLKFSKCYNTNNSSASGKVETAVTNLISVIETIDLFHSSSGQRHYTNFNYVRNYTIYKLKGTILVLKSLQSDVKSVFEVDFDAGIEVNEKSK